MRLASCAPRAWTRDAGGRLGATRRAALPGKQIEFVTADTKSDQAQGANAAIEVLEQGAELVLVTCDFDFGSPAAITAQSRGKIAFSLPAYP